MVWKIDGKPRSFRSRDLSVIGLDVLAVGMSEVRKLIELSEKYSGAGFTPGIWCTLAVMVAMG